MLLASPADASSITTHASEAAIPTTTVLTVEVASPFPRPGDVEVQDDSGNTLATCQGSNSAGTATCTVTVNTEKGVILVAQPLTPGEFKNWNGTTCWAAPGPVCHISIHVHSVKVVSHFGPSGPVPAAVPNVAFVEGDTAGCSGFNDVVTVNRTDFPAITPVALSDNGNQVASGSTDNQGFAQLTYTANSEPGVYRTLVMGAGGATATTDIFNEGSFCLYQSGTGTGTDSFQVGQRSRCSTHGPC
jgi:hypothetical protein